MTVLNYTNAATMRAAMGGEESYEDTLLDKFAGIASRDIDHVCAQTDDPACQEYFKLEDVVGEVLTNGLINNHGHLVCYPHKSFVRSIASLSWGVLPGNSSPVDVSNIVVKPHAVEVWGGDFSALRGQPFLVTLSYSGGMATTIDGLDPLLVDIATVWAMRKYKEERSGMSDVVGVVELGTVTYTQGIPMSVVRDLQPFKRTTPWT